MGLFSFAYSTLYLPTLLSILKTIVARCSRRRLLTMIFACALSSPAFFLRFSFSRLPPPSSLPLPQSTFHSTIC